MSVFGMIVVALPPAPDWHGQEAFATVFNFVPRMVVASLIAYWAGEFVNALVMAHTKMNTHGRHLWMRTILSTAARQSVDSILVMLIAYRGTLSWDLIFTLIYSGYLGKVAYGVIATPVSYFVVNAVRRCRSARRCRNL